MPARKDEESCFPTSCDIFGCESKITGTSERVYREWLKKKTKTKYIRAYKCFNCRKEICRNCVNNLVVKKCSFCNMRMKGTTSRDDGEFEHNDTPGFLDDSVPTSSFPYGVSREYSPIRDDESEFEFPMSLPSSRNGGRNTPSSESTDNHFGDRSRPQTVRGTRIINISDEGVTFGYIPNTNHNTNLESDSVSLFHRHHEDKTESETERNHEETPEDEKDERIGILTAENHSLRLELGNKRKRIKELEDYVTAIQRSLSESAPKKRLKRN